MAPNIPALTCLTAFVGPILGHLVGFPILAHFHVLDSFRFFAQWQVMWTLMCGSVLVKINGGNEFRNSITARSLLLGLLWSTGAQLVFLNYFQPESTIILPLGLYFMTLSFYSFTEFLSIALKNPDSVNLCDFMISYDYSKDRPREGIVAQIAHRITALTYPGFEYHMDFVLPFVGFLFECWYFPELKSSFAWISYLGFLISFAGEVIRKGAMLTAGKNFNHVVQEKHKQGHVLVTDGIYSWWRHPSYVGYYSWHMGHQIILISPIIFAIRATIHWYYMKQRISREEEKLVEFFGPQYIEYRKRVPSGIPFIE